MNVTAIDVGNWTVEGVGLAKTQFEGFQNNTLTTRDILDLCGAFDANAVLAASIGLFVVLAYLFWVRRWRSGCKPVVREFVDKGSLTLVALMFVTIIVRLLRAG